MVSIRFFLSFVIVLITNHLHAFTINGSISDSKGQALKNTPVMLCHTKDSSLEKISVTNDSGSFELGPVKHDNYFISVTTPGFVKFTSAEFELNNDLTLSKFILTEDSKKLKEVEISAKKPLIENKPGKIILNIDAGITNAGKTAFDILEHAPNVSIDQNNTIRMRGKLGVIIMIDGKVTPFSGENLANLLRSYPAQAIEKIEIITNASSKYDASGNAGIINIILKKDKKLGTNATVSLTAGQGRYYKTNDGISINNRNKKLNIYGSYNIGYRKGFNDLSLTRKFYAADTLQGIYDQFNGLVFPFRNHIVRTGADYYLSPKTSIGLTLNGTLNYFEPFGTNHTKVMNQFEQIVSTFTTTNHSKDFWGNYSSNFNVKHTFDSAGTEISLDLDYASYGNKTEQNFNTDYFDLDGNKLRNTYVLFGDIKGRLEIRSVKIDFTRPLGKDAKIESGIKSSYVTADNDLKFYDRTDGNSIFDSTKSNHFIYGENINAGYVNYTNSSGDYHFQLGLRGEQTNVTGKQLINGNNFKNNYMQLFPNIAIDKDFTKKYNAGISLSRRIDRPSYEQLNPFKFFIDPTTYKEGNPYLLPQMSYNFEFSQTFNQKIIATLSYSITNRLITEVLVPAENASNITVQTNVNLTRYDYYGLSLSAPLKPVKWWNSINNMNLYYGYYWGNLANTTLSNGSPAFDINSSNSFMLKNNWSTECNFFYNSGQLYAYMHTKQSGQIGLGIQKTFNERKGTIKLSVNDIFWTAIAAGESKFRDYDEVFFVHRDTRAAFITFTYKLGKATVAPSKRRNGGAEDEKRRANKGGN